MKNEKKYYCSQPENSKIFKSSAHPPPQFFTRQHTMGSITQHKADFIKLIYLSNTS